VSDYQGGWPAQPPASGQGGYQQAGHGRAAYGQAAAPAPRRRRRRRWPAVLVVLLLLIVAALAIGDQVFRSYVQKRFAEQIQSSFKLSAQPSVSIKGWPFTTQVLRHDIGTVDASGSGVTAANGKLKFSYTGQITGLHLNSSFSGGTAQQVTLRLLLPFSSLDSEVNSAVTLSADPAGGPDAVKASLGAAGSLTGTVKLVSSNDIALRFNSASGLASLVPGLSGQTVNLDVPQLPAGITFKSVSVSSQGIAANVTGSNISLTK
jgi:hypothetical protein